MWTTVILLCIVLILAHRSCGLDFIDLPDSKEQEIQTTSSEVSMEKPKAYPPVRPTNPNHRRWMVSGKRSNIGNTKLTLRTGYEDEKDGNLKNKIATLVQQTMHDTERRIKGLQNIKEGNREQPSYRAGFILSMIKKSRDVLNELFNVAIRHRDDWKALEQLKIFELIMHTNVDTTHLVRQLVELHMQNMNSTDDKRVVLL